MNIVSFTTSGAASCPAVAPVENVTLTASPRTESGVIWLRVLKRVLA